MILRVSSSRVFHPSVSFARETLLPTPCPCASRLRPRLVRLRLHAAHTSTRLFAHPRGTDSLRLLHLVSPSQPLRFFTPIVIPPLHTSLQHYPCLIQYSPLRPHTSNCPRPFPLSLLHPLSSFPSRYRPPTDTPRLPLSPTPRPLLADRDRLLSSSPGCFITSFTASALLNRRTTTRPSCFTASVFPAITCELPQRLVIARALQAPFECSLPLTSGRVPLTPTATASSARQGNPAWQYVWLTAV